MALYLGTEKVKINMGGVPYLLKIFTITLPTDNSVLASSDGRVLMDLDGLYLVPKESD